MMKRLERIFRFLRRIAPPRRHVEIGAGAVGAIVALFVAQYWYNSYAALEQQEFMASVIVGGDQVSMRDQQRAHISTGPIPIDRAMRTLAQADRTRLAAIRPDPSNDPAPAAGWMGSPHYVAPPPPVGDEPQPEAPGEPTDQPAEGAPDPEAPTGEEPAAPPTDEPEDAPTDVPPAPAPGPTAEPEPAPAPAPAPPAPPRERAPIKRQPVRRPPVVRDPGFGGDAPTMEAAPPTMDVEPPPPAAEDSP